MGQLSCSALEQCLRRMASLLFPPFVEILPGRCSVVHRWLKRTIFAKDRTPLHLLLFRTSVSSSGGVALSGIPLSFAYVYAQLPAALG